MTEAPRKVLILGGTAWLGRSIAAKALLAGHDVTCAARGVSGTAAPGATLVQIDRSRPDGYRALSDTVWDDVIELAWDPTFVAEALRSLAARAQHWTLVSSVSVYARTDEPGVDESAATVDAGPVSDFGAAKVAAETITVEHVGDRALIVRPGIIAGPGDISDRLGYWPARLAAATDEEVLIPDPAGRWLQCIDVEDLASWIVDAGSQERVGVFNTVGYPYPFDDFLRLAAAVTGFRGTFTIRSDDALLSQDVACVAGPRSLPFWLPPEDAGFLQRGSGAFVGAGARVRSLSDTLARTLADERARGLDRDRAAGLSRAEELAVLRATA